MWLAKSHVADLRPFGSNESTIEQSLRVQWLFQDQLHLKIFSFPLSFILLETTSGTMGTTPQPCPQRRDGLENFCLLSPRTKWQKRTLSGWVWSLSEALRHILLRQHILQTIWSWKSLLGTQYCEFALPLSVCLFQPQSEKGHWTSRIISLSQ